MSPGTKVTRGHVTKRGSRLPRWALIEAIQRIPKDSMIGAAKDAIIARRGKEAKNIAKVAAARRLLTLVFYGMRDGQIRCLAKPPAGPGDDPDGAGRMTGSPWANGQARGRQAFCPPPGARPQAIPPPAPARQGAHLMLGQPISMLILNVVGFRLTGELAAGTTATDLVLMITERLRRHGVVGKFVEFHCRGGGLS